MMWMTVPATGVEPMQLFPYAQKLRRALAMSEMSEKQAALTMGVDQSEFSKQLAGMPGHHISFGRLLKLPIEFWEVFLPDLAAHFGFRLESQDALAAATADILNCCANVMRLVTLASDEQQPQRKRA